MKTSILAALLSCATERGLPFPINPVSRASLSSGSLAVRFLQAKLRERLVGSNLFLLGRFEKFHDVILAELFGPRFERAIAGDIIMFYRLSGGDQTSVQGRGVLELFHDAFAFFDDAEDRIAGLPTGRLAEDFENLLQTFDVALGLFEVLFETGPQLIGLGGFRHFGQSLRDLPLGVVDVL